MEGCASGVRGFRSGSAWRTGDAGVEALLLREVEPLLTGALLLRDGGVPKDSSLLLDAALLADSSLLLGGEVELPKNFSLDLGGEIELSDCFSFTLPASFLPRPARGDASSARATRTGPLGDTRGGKLKCLGRRVTVRGGEGGGGAGGLGTWEVWQKWEQVWTWRECCGGEGGGEHCCPAPGDITQPTADWHKTTPWLHKTVS